MEEAKKDDQSFEQVANNLIDFIDIIVYSNDEAFAHSLVAEFEKESIKAKALLSSQQLDDETQGSFPKVAIMDLLNKEDLKILQKNVNDCCYIVISQDLSEDLIPLTIKNNCLGYYTKPIDLPIILGHCKKVMEKTLLPAQESRAKYLIKSGNPEIIMTTFFQLTKITQQSITFESSMNLIKGSSFTIQNSFLNEFFKKPIIDLCVKNTIPAHKQPGVFMIVADFVNKDDQFLNLLRNFLNTESSRLETLKPIDGNKNENRSEELKTRGNEIKK